MVWSMRQNNYHGLSLRLRSGRAIGHLPLISAWFLVALKRWTAFSVNGIIREAE
jgi:hypothetical protein